MIVTCLYVKGEYPYTVDYVRRLRMMVSAWIDRPFRFCCLTDQPEAMPDGVEPIAIAKLPDCFAYWTKLELFNPARNFTGRVLYLDLDTLIVNPLQPIIDYPAAFALTADPPRPGMKTRDAFGRQIIRKFNSSVMAWDGGTQTHLYTNWRPAHAERLSGDQDYTAEQCTDAAGMPRQWFPRLSEVIRPPFHPDVKVILSKKPKNEIACQDYSWFAPLWGAA